MRIGIIGSGNVGGTLAKLVAGQGHEVAVANSRGPDSLSELVAEAGEGVRAATVEDAIDFGELVVVAVPLRAYRELPRDGFAGKIVVDANNYFPNRDGQIDALDRDETTSTELLAEHLRGSRAVKAFNTMNFRTLAAEGRPDAPRAERLALFLAGDDELAKRTVADLIEQIGFAPVDTGSLSEGGRRQQPGSALLNASMRAPEAERALSE
jgi:predicted dinucleotide-binding enzyme